MSEWPVHILAVAGLIYNLDGDVLIAKATRKNTWGLLGGQVEVGENLEEALKREIFEESSVEVEVKKVVGMYSNIQQTTWHDGKTTVPTKLIIDFICEYKSGSPTISDEISELKWVKPEEALKLFSDPILALRLKNLLEFDGNVMYSAYTSQPYEKMFNKKY